MACLPAALTSRRPGPTSTERMLLLAIGGLGRVDEVHVSAGAVAAVDSSLPRTVGALAVLALAVLLARAGRALLSARRSWRDTGPRTSSLVASWG